MPNSIGSLIRSFGVRVAMAVCLVCVGVPRVLGQQPPAEPPSGAHFFPRYDFAMSAALLGYDDPRFTWDTHWAGDFDLVDYGYGRTAFLLDYQAMLGSEFRAFDPYQSNYLLEASSSVRASGFEVAGVLNHVSRHFGDRFKRVAVAENSLGVRVMRTAAPNSTTSLAIQVDARKVIARAYVDYNWLTDLDMTLRKKTGARASVYGRLLGQGYTVDPTVAGRTFQYGGRTEAGVRVDGTAGAVDFFVGSERVIDADPIDRLPRRWAFFGFRLVGK